MQINFYRNRALSITALKRRDSANCIPKWLADEEDVGREKKPKNKHKSMLINCIRDFLNPNELLVSKIKLASYNY